MCSWCQPAQSGSLHPTCRVTLTVGCQWKNDNCGKGQQHLTLIFLTDLLSKPDVHFQNECRTVVLCSLSAFPDTFLIYGSMFIATAQLNDYVFVSYYCQNYITRLLRTKLLMCYLNLYKAGLIHSNGWQASSCDCKVCAISVFWG